MKAALAALRATKVTRWKFFKPKSRVFGETIWLTGGELSGDEDILHQTTMRTLQ